MLELLKKIGLPATVAAVIATLITVIPFLFKIDERYAKASELEQAVGKVDKQMQALTVEVGRLAGIQQVLVAIAGQSVAREASGSRPVSSSGASQPAATVAEPVPPVVFTPPTLPTVKTDSKPIPVETVVLPAAPAPNASIIERKEVLDRARVAVEATQRNIESIKKY